MTTSIILDVDKSLRQGNERCLYSGEAVNTGSEKLFLNVSERNLAIVMKAVSGKTRIIGAKSDASAKESAISFNNKLLCCGTQIK